MLLYKRELDQVCGALRSGQSMLVLGEAGAGKSTLAEQVKDVLGDEGYRVAIGIYLGSAKSTLQGICEELEVPTTIDLGDKEKAMTLEELRCELAKHLVLSKYLLIVDDAQRFPASLKYWLEAVLKDGALMLLLADRPPAAGIFLKMPRIEMDSLQTDVVRALMSKEALDQGMTLSAGDFAELEQRVGGNPALAKRAVREYALGLGEGGTDHRRYVDGTPFLIAALSIIGVVRFIGLGLGDKALYIVGGIATIAAISLRTLFTQANRKSNKLGR